jgi:ABC-type uncharacterized transport system involved in gliding motility auxiliary subunit
MERVEMRRRLAFGSTLGAAALLAVALAGLLNHLGARHYQRSDWTRSRIYSLSERTQNILSSLEQDIEVAVFMDPQARLYEPVKEILARYEAASPRISVRHVDPARNLAEAQRLVERFEIPRAEVVVFAADGDRRVVEAADLADYDYSAMQMGGAPEMSGFKGEQQFTSAILQLVESRRPRILFTTGHGEAELDGTGPDGLSRLGDFLGRDNFELEEWRSLGAQQVPAGTDLLVVAGPTSAFTPPELEVFGRYLEGGGRILVLLDPALGRGRELADAALSEWLGDYGVVVADAVVVDPSRLLPFFGADTIFADDYGSHPITDALRQARLPVVFSLARPVSAREEMAGVEATELLRTSSEGWGETDLDALGSVRRDAEDIPGPVSLGVAVEVPAGAMPLGGAAVEEGAWPDPAEGELASPVAPLDGDDGGDPGSRGGRLVIFGDADFVSNANLAQAGNATLVANTLNWLVEREAHLGIAPKEPEQVRLSLDRDQRRAMFWLVVAGIPGLTLVAGVMVFMRRRR